MLALPFPTVPQKSPWQQYLEKEAADNAIHCQFDPILHPHVLQEYNEYYRTTRVKIWRSHDLFLIIVILLSPAVALLKIDPSVKTFYFLENEKGVARMPLWFWLCNALMVTVLCLHLIFTFNWRHQHNPHIVSIRYAVNTVVGVGFAWNEYFFQVLCQHQKDYSVYCCDTSSTYLFVFPRAPVEAI